MTQIACSRLSDTGDAARKKLGAGKRERMTWVTVKRREEEPRFLEVWQNRFL